MEKNIGTYTQHTKMPLYFQVHTHTHTHACTHQSQSTHVHAIPILPRVATLECHVSPPKNGVGGCGRSPPDSVRGAREWRGRVFGAETGGKGEHSPNFGSTPLWLLTESQSL